MEKESSRVGQLDDGGKELPPFIVDLNAERRRRSEKIARGRPEKNV